MLSSNPATLEAARHHELRGLMAGPLPELCAFLAAQTAALRAVEAEQVGAKGRRGTHHTHIAQDLHRAWASARGLEQMRHGRGHDAHLLGGGRAGVHT